MTNDPQQRASRRGTRLPQRDLTSDELAAAPVMDSFDALLIDELSDKEDEAFAAALEA